MNNKNYSLEMWRGIAAFMVVWAHWGVPLKWPMGPMEFSFTGVNLFFVLSGFIFAPIIFQKNNIDFFSFIFRRVSRIYPAYLITLIAFIIIANADGRELLYIKEHLLFLHLQSKEIAFYYNPAFWSLTPEFSFYILIPIICLIRLDFRFKIIIFLILLSINFRFQMLLRADNENIYFILAHHIPSLLVEFLIGSIFWKVYDKRILLKNKYALIFIGIVGWLLLSIIFSNLQKLENEYPWKNGQLGLFASVFFGCAILGTIYAFEHISNKKKVEIIFSWLGKISYPVYLLHMIWLPYTLELAESYGSILGNSLGIFGLLVTSLLLHVIVEDPLRNFGRIASNKFSQKTSVSPG